MRTFTQLIRPTGSAGSDKRTGPAQDSSYEVLVTNGQPREAPGVADSQRLGVASPGAGSPTETPISVKHTGPRLRGWRAAALLHPGAAAQLAGPRAVSPIRMTCAEERPRTGQPARTQCVAGRAARSRSVISRAASWAVMASFLRS